MNDGAMTTELAESGFQTDRNMKQIAVADRMLDLAGPAKGSHMSRKLDHRLAQRVVDAQAFDGGFARGDDLELAPAHALADGDGVLLRYRAAAIDI